MREFWDVFFEKFSEGISTTWDWLNKPLPVVCVSIVTIFIFVITIINRTSFGRHAIKHLISIADKTDKKALETEKIVLEYKNSIDERINEYTANINEKIATLTAQFDYFENSIVDAVYQIPNVKVRNEILAFKDGYDAKKQEIAEIIGSNYQVVMNEREEKIKMLENAITELTEKVKELKDEREKINIETTL